MKNIKIVYLDAAAKCSKPGVLSSILGKFSFISLSESNSTNADGTSSNANSASSSNNGKSKSTNERVIYLPPKCFRYKESFLNTLDV